MQGMWREHTFLKCQVRNSDPNVGYVVTEVANRALDHITRPAGANLNCKIESPFYIIEATVTNSRYHRGHWAER